MRPDLEIMKSYLEETLRLMEEGKTEEAMRLRRAVLEEALTRASSVLEKALKLSNELMNEIEKGYEKAGYEVGSLLLGLKSPGLVGAGSGPFKTIFEVGLNVDPVLGLPFYPGSGVKGAVRNSFEAALGKDLAEEVFGGERSSLVIFSDMYPVGCSGECSVYRGLVVSPHYYRGGKLVEDELDVQPNPVVHLGIAEGLVFKLVIAVKKSREAKGVLKKIKEASEREFSVLARTCEKGSLLYPVAFMTFFTLNQGFSARSTKGYNVFDLFDGNLSFKVVSWDVKGGSRGGR